MKKFLIFALAAMFMFASCDQKSKQQTKPFEGYQFEQVVQSDYDLMVGQNTEYVFYEAEVEFSQPLSICDEHIINKITTVFQSQDSVILYEHYKGNTIRSAYNDRWLEDMECNPYDAVPLNSVLYNLQDKQCMPQTKFVTFRRPLAPPFDSCAYFIFGQAAVVINACTGEIIE